MKTHKILGALMLAYSANLFATEYPLDLKVIPEEKSCDIILKMEVTNNSSTQVTINSNNLPWTNNVFGISLILQEINSSKAILDQIHGIERAIAFIKIEPGETIKGEVHLQGRFPEFSKKIKKTDLALYWNYAFEKIEGNRPIKIGSHLLSKCDK